MGQFEELKNELSLTDNHRVMLGSVAMILMPAWFFSGILQRFIKAAGPEIAAEVYYDAGYDGAYRWGKVQVEAGLTGQKIMEQYLGSMTHRGWGRFQIVEFDGSAGNGRFRLFNSAIAIDRYGGDETVCLWVPGALAGAMQVILDHNGVTLKVRGKEDLCLAQGKPYCEFSVKPF